MAPPSELHCLVFCRPSLGSRVGGAPIVVVFPLTLVVEAADRIRQRETVPPKAVRLREGDTASSSSRHAAGIVADTLRIGM